jgi:hypothetical protein
MIGLRFYDATNPERHRLIQYQYDFKCILECRLVVHGLHMPNLLYVDSLNGYMFWIANYPGMELKQRIQGRLGRIAVKHIPIEED